MKAAIAEASSFVGREQELVALDRLRGEGARLVTIVGASGAGKSRLASRWAARHAAADDGVPSVWVVDLAAAAAVDEVLDAIAAALEVELAPAARVDRALALLGSALAARGPALLVLDDFDRAVARAAGVVAALVARAPDATFLVTSREALGVEGEHRLEVSPLGLEEAAALFEARARAVGSGRALPAADRAAVLELVRRLDGLPLAVELAAGWAGALPPAVLTARLEQRLDLLRRAPRGEAPRHASLRGALDASWELLPEAERLVLARCAAFQGAFTLEAAEAVAAGGAIGPAAVAGLLRALRDRSLVAAAPAEPLDGELPRFALLESVRAYGAEKAVAAGEGEAAERRHAAYVVEAAEGLAAGARGRDGPRCRRKLAGLVDDLAAAYRVAATRDPGLAARAVLGAAPHFLNRGPLEAYAAALDAAVDLAARSDEDRLRARALRTRAEVRARLGRVDEAELDLAMALPLARRTGDAALERESQAMASFVHLRAQRLEDAEASARAALALAQAIDAPDKRAAAMAHRCLADVHAARGVVSGCRAQLELALALAREAGDGEMQAEIGSSLGVLAHQRGESAAARARYEQALATAREAGLRRVEGAALANLGVLDHEDGALASAEARLEAAVDVLSAVGDVRTAAVARGNLGVLRHEQGHLEEARALLEESSRRLEALGLAPLVSAPLAHLAALEARRGLSSPRPRDRTEPLGVTVQAMFARARGAAGNTRAPPRAFGVLEGFLDLALARDAAVGESTAAGAAANGEATRAAHLAAARARWAQAAGAGASASAGEAPPLRVPRIAMRLLAAALAAEESNAQVERAPGSALVVGSAAEWFEPPGGARVDLSRRGSLRRVLARLADQRAAAPGEALPQSDLLAAGWPGERVLPDAGANRVYVAVATLRRLGLHELLVTGPSGYLLDVSVRLRRADEPA